MGAEAARYNLTNNTGYPQIEACKGCPFTTPENVMVAPTVGRALLQFDKAKFVRECPQELSPELTDEDRFEACRARMIETVMRLMIARDRLRNL